MEFSKIKLSVPNELQEILLKIQSFEEKAIIAGGFLSDLYMNESPKDVDFFIPYNEKTYKKIMSLFDIPENKELKDKEFEDYTDNYLVDISTLFLNEHDIQLIFTLNPDNPVKRFDFRFREFFYDGVNTFATKEAILDIKNKEFVFGITENPLRSLKRLNKFLKKYKKFSIDKKSFNVLKNLLDNYYPKISTAKIISSFNLVTPSTFLEKKIKGIIDKKGFFVFDKTEIKKDILMYIQNNLSLTRSELEKILYKNDYYQKEFSPLFKENYYEVLISEKLKEIKKIVKTNRLKILSKTDPTTANAFFNFCEKINEKHYNLFSEIKYMYETFDFKLEELEKTIEEFFYLKEKKYNFSERPHFTLTNNYPLVGEESAKEILDNELVCCKYEVYSNVYDELDKKGGIKMIIYFNYKTGKIYRSSADKIQERIYKKAISEFLNSSKLT